MQIGPYAVQGELGRGGMGVVYRARGPDGREVAVKVLLPEVARTASARFDRERRLLAELGSDDGFVTLLDSGQGPTGPYVVMPLVTGGTLRDRLERGPLELDAALDLARALAGAVGRAHGKGIVHRDLKPENVLFTAEGRALVADLGLAKHYSTAGGGTTKSVALSRTGELRGTPTYMAPEQCRDAKNAGAPADVFSLGAIIYECVTGVPAFHGSSLPEVLHAVLSTTPPSIASLRPGAPPWLDAVVARALDKEAERRHRDGADLLRSLDGGRASAGVAPLVGLALVAAAVVALIALRPAPAPPPPPPPATVTPPVEPPRRQAAPAWYEGLPRGARPPLPLPQGVAFGPGPREYVNEKDGSVLVFLETGSFAMGTETEGADTRPVHSVEVSGHFLGKHEVTAAQFDVFVRATGHVTTAEQEGGAWLRTSAEGTPRPDDPGKLLNGLSWRHAAPEVASVRSDTPVLAVSWWDAVAYCRWAGLRLATEAEWERACGWDTLQARSRRFPWGTSPAWAMRPLLNAADRSLAARYPNAPVDGSFDDGFPRAAPVGTYPEGAAPNGALDLLGNAAEWCQDAYDETYYAHAARRDPVRELTQGDTYDQRCCRGGSYRNDPRILTSWRRTGYPSRYRSDDVGFRVARDGR